MRGWQAKKRRTCALPVDKGYARKCKTTRSAGGYLFNPDIWVLDEPTVGLDVMAVEELKKMMREYADHGKTVFVTSHNIELVSRICDRVAIVNNGVVAALYDLNKEPNRRLQLGKLFMETYGE